MSTTIRSMSMPRDCEHCVLCDYEQANCLVANDRNTLPHISNERPDWCPLVEVPTPHGDLIGRNPLIDIAMHLRNRAKDEYTKRVIGSVIRYIAEAPTIIPADEPKEEEKC